MHRIILPFLSHGSATGSRIQLESEEARYLRTVLRMRPGQEVLVCGPGGRRVIAELADSSRGRAELELKKELPPVVEPPTGIILVQGLLKGAKMDLVVQKATELGVKEIVPVVCERSQVRSTRKAARWRKIALEAARQSGRPGVPGVSDASGLDEFLARFGSLRGYVFSESEAEGLALERIRSDRDIYLIVGPEGGLTREEVQAAVGRGLVPTGLGQNILRAETASIAAVSLVRYLMGEMG